MARRRRTGSHGKGHLDSGDCHARSMIIRIVAPQLRALQHLW
jgi:hypothetical protein